MNLRSLLVLGLAATAVAQSPRLAQKSPTRPESTARPSMTSQSFDAPLFDQAADGTVFAAGDTWKASFATDGVRFHPFLGSDLPTTREVHFAPAEVRLAGRQLPVTSAVAALGEGEVAFARGAFREAYRVTSAGIEQTFTFDRLPTRGELAFAIRTGGDLAPSRDGDDLAFVHERGRVTYTQAVAIDAAGRRLPLLTTADGGVIHFAVPAAFVADAALPLVVDPQIGTVYTSAAFTYVIDGTDTAYDDSAAEWQIAWARTFSQTDRDVYVQRLSANLTALSVGIVDSSVDDWRTPSIANLALYNRFLIVSPMQVNQTTTRKIGGRISTTGTNLMATGQFEIEGPAAAGNLGLPAVACDVGGDPSSVGPTYWTVVFESKVTGLNSDVYARQVTDSGALRGAAPIAIATTSSPESRPRISKSNGRGAFQTQTWGVAYAFNSWIVQARSLSWNGIVLGPEQDQIIGLEVGAPFDISSPTDEVGGQRYLLTVAECEGLPVNGLDVIGQLSDRTMNSVANPISLSELGLSASDNQRDQFQPAVDCDGVRFVLAYAHTFSAVDLDIITAVIQPDFSVWGAMRQVAGEVLADATTREHQPVVCAARSGGGGPLRYSIAWSERDGVNEMFHATLFDGYQTGATFTTRATGCGGTVGITTVGLPYSGQSFTMQRNGPGFGGFVFGLPVTLPVPGCAGCTQGATGSTLFGDQVVVQVPGDASFVGMTFAFQGFDLAGGPCLGQVALSDTVDATIR